MIHSVLDKTCFVCLFPLTVFSMRFVRMSYATVHHGVPRYNVSTTGHGDTNCSESFMDVSYPNPRHRGIGELVRVPKMGSNK